MCVGGVLGACWGVLGVLHCRCMLGVYWPLGVCWVYVERVLGVCWGWGFKLEFMAISLKIHPTYKMNMYM